MFAIYCQKPQLDDPMGALIVGDRTEPKIPEGWVRVKVSHASLNRHDIFTLRGITSHAEGIAFPMIVPNENAVWPRTNRFFSEHVSVVSDICCGPRASGQALRRVSAVRHRYQEVSLRQRGRFSGHQAAACRS